MFLLFYKVLARDRGSKLDLLFVCCLICFAGTDLGVDSASPFQPAVVRFAAGFLGVQVAPLPHLFYLGLMHFRYCLLSNGFRTVVLA